jgi:hypothetical protein
MRSSFLSSATSCSMLVINMPSYIFSEVCCKLAVNTAKFRQNHIITSLLFSLPFHIMFGNVSPIFSVAPITYTFVAIAEYAIFEDEHLMLSLMLYTISDYVCSLFEKEIYYSPLLLAYCPFSICHTITLIIFTPSP